MLGGINNNIAQQLAGIYSSNNAKLTDILKRIASGKQVGSASDDPAAFLKAKGLQTDIEQYEDVKEDLVEARGMAESAIQAGNAVYEDLARMKELAELYPDGTAAQKSAYSAEFDALKSSVSNAIDDSYFEGTKLLASGTLSSYEVNPSGSSEFDISFAAGDIPSVAAGSLTASNGTAAVQTELDKITSYISKAETYENDSQTYIDLSDSVISTKESVISAITDIDDAKELAKATDLQVRQQAAVAMMAQANLMRGIIFILGLIDNETG